MIYTYLFSKIFPMLCYLFIYFILCNQSFSIFFNPTSPLSSVYNLPFLGPSTCSLQQSFDEIQIKKENDLPKIIGITGHKRNGKDTLGEYLVTKYGYIRMSIAEPLKNICKEIFGLDEEQVNGEKKEEIDTFWNETPRNIMNFIGTDLLRNQFHYLFPKIGKNIWIKVMEKKIINIWKKNPNQKIVITDVRFKNDYTLVKKYNGIVIRVIRENENNKIENIHESEKFINHLKTDYDIHNNSTKENLYNRMDIILSNI